VEMDIIFYTILYIPEIGGDKNNNFLKTVED
jgi:hypothetical protein